MSGVCIQRMLKEEGGEEGEGGGRKWGKWGRKGGGERGDGGKGGGREALLRSLGRRCRFPF